MDRRRFLCSQLGMLGTGMLLSKMGYAQSMHHMHNMTENTQVSALFTGQLPTGKVLPPLTLLTNTASAAKTFQAKLVAAPLTAELIPHKKTVFWSYNGQVPGPLIDVYEGDTVEIVFENQLSQPSTVHWHGLPVPSEEDGNPVDIVAPGEKRTYRFTLPEGSAGTYWYHPHPHHYTAEQAFRGLAGPFIVRAKNDPLRHLPESHLLFSDVKLDTNLHIPDNDMLDWMNGREGQFVLVNGQLRPKLTVNGPQRWRLWNACNAHYLQLTGVSMVLVGTDGGLLEKPQPVNSLLLSPGERAEVVVIPQIDQQQVVLTAKAYARGKMSMQQGDVPPEQDIPLVDVLLKGSKDAYVLPAFLRKIPALGTPQVTRQVIFTESVNMKKMGMKNGRPTGMQFMINGREFDHARIDFTGFVNDIEQWEIINATEMDHPFHIHGTQFQVINRQTEFDTVQEPFLAWRDMVNVKPGEIVRIRLQQTMVGDRMFHCHILEHEDLGMMGTLRVVKRD